MTLPNQMTLRTLNTILTGIAGGATAQTISFWGTDIARFLPPMLILTLAACAGAGAAGAIMVGAFGRRGPAGFLLMSLAWPATTILGAAFASIPFGLLEVGLQSSPIATLIKATEAGAPLGVFAVFSGIFSSPQVALIWIVSAVFIHVTLRAERPITT